MTQHAIAAMEIRPYRAADRGACLAIFRSNLPRYFDASELAEFEEFLDQPVGDYCVVTLDACVLACGGCYVHDGLGYLSWGMVAREKHLGKLGTALLRWRVQHLFTQHQVAEIRIDTSQHTAGFFARHGFRTTQQIPHGFGVGIDQVSMALRRADWLPGG